VLTILLIAAGALSVLIWIYLLFGRGKFWQVREFELLEPGGGNASERVAVILPARNEAEVIAQSLTSLLNQSYGAIHIFLVDDNSSDQTAQIAREMSQECGRPELVTIIPGRPLPTGWTGKLWAVHQGIQAANEFEPDFFLFTDADIVHPKGGIASLVTRAEAGAYDLVSVMVKLRCKTFAEKLLIPAFVFFFFKLYSPTWTADVDRVTAGAAGGCMLMRPQAVARIGGISAIRGEIIDDCALARRVKDAGGKLWLGITSSTYSLRTYSSFSGIGEVISRTAFSQLRHSWLLLGITVTGLAIAYLLPPALLFTGRVFPIVLGVVAWTAMTIAYLRVVRFYALRHFWALTLPLAALFFMGATMASAVKFWRHRGGEWKGRIQDLAS
jgi:hopene-associated glycosyltransferase HpnB